MPDTSTCQQYLPLKVSHVSYQVHTDLLLDNVNLEFNDLKRSIILGHNGAGKSLLLKLLHGVIQPTQGQITWHKQTPNTQQYWRSLLLQKPSFFARSVRYNIEFVLNLAGIAKAQQANLCDEALNVCGLVNIADRKTHLLSGGEAQKLSLARAWVLKPAILLMDEPTVALDPPSVISFENIIHEFKQAHTKIIITTHDLAQAKRMADEIVFVHNGKILEHSPAENFFQQPHTDTAQKFISGEL
jgi:tungstate transport system ATP-binding protein